MTGKPQSLNGSVGSADRWGPPRELVKLLEVGGVAARESSASIELIMRHALRVAIDLRQEGESRVVAGFGSRWEQ